LNRQRPNVAQSPSAWSGSEMSNMITDTESAAKQTSRPSVMTLAIKELNALYAAYMPFVETVGCSCRLSGRRSWVTIST
jgi:hypothetical protein